ncbi:orotidine 5'-phosphate decarboxylase [Heyndrickxia shackletonii]|uniref:Orotidine 5'-phosphate decarboxylase n=1 Tax=Heyndrickxia shackletonii TaxID=157838 RepID=A0A0Q3WYU4_9BACI|nr:orotidine-5'-phosphate decarboxylase [Heyndrickxia shackletonii]KQL54691.1 orotidine 5'-phosphate decarboxylase [Heyndrickxia shackletonii]NEY98342.1 orotidine-5'-phosphate decarboxylase [Heyndrickxia shackletonii]
MKSFKPIIALDFPNEQETLSFLNQFREETLYVKVGMELYYQTGPSLIEQLKSRGHQIFLDLKLHDIPNTVYSAMKGLAKLGVDMVNVHAAGGANMMKAALSGLEEGTEHGKERPLLIAVTQLTSTSEEQMKTEQLINTSLNESILHYARLTFDSGLDGVVCSALEAKIIDQHIGYPFIKVTPGIRLHGDNLHDQKRVVTPEKARELGSSAIVVGRSITKSDNPYETYMSIKNTWEAK